MKKLFTTIVMTAFALTTFAQATQPYFRVEFTVPITGDKIPQGQSNNSVAATMKDDYTFCNPAHEYLDFQGVPMSFRTTTNNATKTSGFYIENGRKAQGGVVAKYPYLVDKIKKITAYSIPVEKITCDSTTTHKYKFPGDGKTYKVAEFTFNRLPRNVAELKTLIEPNGKLAGTGNPLFVAACLVAVWPRILDCSQDCRDMINYLFGTHYSQLNTIGISNMDFQDVCIAGLVTKDGAGAWKYNSLFGYFKGATPGNQYKPNGTGYDKGPFKVRVGWHPTSPLSPVGQWGGMNMAKICLFPNPDATQKPDMGFENPIMRFVELRETKKNGWFVSGKAKVVTMSMKDQFDDSF
ncbi:MAG: hypothetical protein PUH24_03570 [Prevotellaceae bacterium]|nr:hypothetical protein [Prevotella sp.]MDD7257343.1 hypothetical protein [Prevotellaceae bacterium]MDY6131078.1 hypothetical protein [Prevotella sp.]